MASPRGAPRAPLTAGAAAGRAPIPIAAVDREHAALHDQLQAAVLGVFRDARFVLGPRVAAFERELAAYLGDAHVVGCGSGTDALVLALRALEIGVGHEVIVPAFTFGATAEAVVLVGATPVFADIEPDTLTIDAAAAAALVGPRTRAIIPVHLYGQCAHMEPLRELASHAGLKVIEDAAQAIGARWQGRPAGTLGDAAAFSFYPTKNLGGSGDGGAVVSSDARLAERVRRLRTHGRHGERYEAIGTNSRLDEIQAAVLSVKLRHLDAWNDKRRAHAARYRDAAGPHITPPVERQGEQSGQGGQNSRHVYHQFTVRTPRRAQLIARLDAAGVGSAVYYPRGLHDEPAYARWRRGSLPETERAAAEVVSVPVHPWLSDDEVERVAAILADAS